MCWFFLTNVSKQHGAFRGFGTSVCVGRVLKKRRALREKKRRESGRESVRERKGAGLLISSKSAWYWLAKITRGGKQPRCIMLFLHRGSTIDRIPHWQTPWTFLAACIRNLSRTQREQQQHKLKGCHSVLSEATGDLGFWWRVWCYSCVKQQPGCWGRTRSFVIISAGNGVLQNTLYVQYFIRLIIVISWKGCSYSTWQTPRNVELPSKRTISCSLEIIFPVQFSVFDRYLLAFVCFSHQQYLVYDIALW